MVLLLSYTLRDYPTSLQITYSAPLIRAALVMIQSRDQDSGGFTFHNPMFMIPLALMKVVHETANTTTYSWNFEHYTNFDLPDGLWFLHLSNPDMVQSAVLQRETPPRPPVPPGVSAFHRFQRYAFPDNACVVTKHVWVDSMQGLFVSEPPKQVVWDLSGLTISEHDCCQPIHEHCYWVPIFPCAATWPPPETCGIAGRVGVRLTFETCRERFIVLQHGAPCILSADGYFETDDYLISDIWVPLTRDTARQIPISSWRETSFRVRPRLTWSDAKEMIQCMQILRTRSNQGRISVNDQLVEKAIQSFRERWNTALPFYVGYVLALNHTRLPQVLVDLVLEFAAEL